MCLAIDDFGTGYASFSYLSQLPFDVLKVDRSLVSGESANKPALLKAILEVGQMLSLTTLAEGVEDKAQLPSLVEYGCHLVQGFGFSKPLPARAATHLLEACRDAGPAPAQDAPAHTF